MTHLANATAVMLRNAPVESTTTTTHVNASVVTLHHANVHGITIQTHANVHAGLTTVIRVSTLTVIAVVASVRSTRRAQLISISTKLLANVSAMR